MRNGMSRMRHWVAAFVLMVVAGPLVAPPAAAITEEPPRIDKQTPFNHDGPFLPPILDFLLLRPPAIAATAVGVAVWVVVLPFNLLARDEWLASSTDVLIVKPGRYAFVDPLGSH